MLTVAQVRAVGPGKHSDGGNLWLRVGPTGSKAWIFRYTLAGRTREMGLGPWPRVSLAEAREKAAAQRRLLHEGKPPLSEREAQRREPVSFADAAGRYLAIHERSWSSRDHARQWRNSLNRYVLTVIGDK